VRRARAFLSLALAGGLLASPAAPSPAPEIAPVPAPAPTAQRLLQHLGADRIASNLKTLASVPRLAGTPTDRRMADWVAGQLKEAGLKVEVSEYQVWLPYPVSISVEALAPEPYKCRLREAGNLIDPDTTMPGVVMPYNAFSPSGSAEGELVYVNYGLREDYEALEKLEVPVKGRIVIARYGRGFRGDKVALAAEKGAIGCLLYSDPADDGYMKGDVLPRGPWRDEWAVQRGSILRGAGDPLTPGRAAVTGAPRLDPSEVTLLPRIPCTPLSYGDARPLLEQLNGPLAPHEAAGSRSWQGGLPFAYHVGPGPTRVKMSVSVEYASRTIWDVVGRLDGASLPDEAILLGAHRDSWGPGGMDNGSGSATLLELARAFGEMAQAGERPSRTLMFAFWDAEEFGIIGSTEWAEEHAAWLARSAAAYLNVDVAATGPRFSPSGSPSLANLLLEAAGDVTDPGSRKSVRETWQSANRDAKVSDLGGGSDFVPFSNDFGVPSTSHGFSGDGGGAYHSASDTFWFVSTFMDPGFIYHEVSAAVWGAAALRLSEAPALPYDQAAIGRQAIVAADDLEAQVTQQTRGVLPSLDPMRDAARRFIDAAQRLDSRRRRLPRSAGAASTIPLWNAVSRQALASANAEQIAADREFVIAEPAPGGATRGRHLLLSPSVSDGYGAQRLPAIAAAWRAGDAARASAGISEVAAAFDRASAHLDTASRALREVQ